MSGGSLLRTAFLEGLDPDAHDLVVTRTFEFRGAAQELQTTTDHEVIIAGPYDTGKTIGALYKLHNLLMKHKNARALMARKTLKSLLQSAVVTYEHKILPHPPGNQLCPVKRFGGEQPRWYDYPNGSRLVLGGMDKPDKFLSSEWDYIYINQAEELALDDWEKLVARASGRAGNVPAPLVFADCNPSYPHHWILQRKTLCLLASRHEDNPDLFTADGELTPQGERRMAVLDGLTGLRYQRGRLGKWAGAEGMVYEQWDDDIHLLDWFSPPSSWRRYRAIDFGYTNPFVCQWWAEDEDGRLYLYRELYMTRRTVKVHADEIHRLGAGISRSHWDALEDEDKAAAVAAGEQYAVTVADHAASDRATLEENGIDTVAAKKDISLGIEKVQERLKVRGDGRPRLFILRDALVEPDPYLVERHKPICSQEEVVSYVFAEPKEDKPEKEEPVNVGDHGMDAMRYMVMYFDAELPFDFYEGF